ncbi:MAG: hypothetical protein K2I64_03415 [Muribaculaceae bacterium]|nr:hypothetical protein [Muribaculaceae bacterium]
MKRIIFTLLTIVSVLTAVADVNTDKAMARISRDTKTYISADVRAATEDEAYNEAMQKLSAQITDYFKNERSREAMPDAIYLSNLSSIYERLTSKISDSRYRVMLYVKKSDLKPLGGSDNALVLSKKDDNGYIPVSTEVSHLTPVVKTDTVVTIVKEMLNPTLSQIANLKTRDELAQSLQDLRKSKKISGAAAFPMANANDFYVAVIENDRVAEILHFDKGTYKDIITSQPVDVNRYSHCSGYWFTLP